MHIVADWSRIKPERSTCHGETHVILRGDGWRYPNIRRDGEGKEVCRIPPPPRGHRERAESTQYGDIVLKSPRPYKFATESILADLGFTDGLTPPYEKRFNGTELFRESVKNFYRSESLADRWLKGVMRIVSERLDRTNQGDDARYMARTHDFALAVADREYDAISRVDCGLAAALRRWGDANGDA